MKFELIVESQEELNISAFAVAEYVRDRPGQEESLSPLLRQVAALSWQPKPAPIVFEGSDAAVILTSLDALVHNRRLSRSKDETLASRLRVAKAMTNGTLLDV